jgi:hypothetical protein
MSKQLEAVAPIIDRVNQDEVARSEARVRAMADRLSAISETSTEPLEDSEISEYQGLLRDGIAYREIAPTYAREQVAAAALNLAAKHLGSTATLNQWQTLARQLATYGDVRLMESHLEILRNTQITAAPEQRAAAAQTRMGIDTVVPAPAGGGSATEFSVLERKVADGRFTKAEFSRYAKLYEELRRGG